MYNSADIDKNGFIKLMESLKRLNQINKDIQNSKEFVTGRKIQNFKTGINTSEGRRYIQSCIQIILHPELEEDAVLYNNPRNINYFSDEEFVVYTSIFGNYDKLNEPYFVPDNCKFYVLTDKEVDETSIWKKLPAEQIIPGFDKMNNVQKNRYCKMHPHLLFPNVRYTIYVDGNVCPVTDLTEMVNLCTNHGMALHLHRNRQCVYKEIEVCKIVGKAPKVALERYKRFLKENKFPDNYGLLECNVIVRDNDNIECRMIMEEWWELFEKMEAKRDQLSFVYILFKHGIKPYEVATLGNNVYQNNAIQIISHKNQVF